MSPLTAWCRWFFLRVAAVMVVIGALCLIAGLALAQSDGHARWHHYYKHWKQPGTNKSCCDARVIGPDGAETGDCEPTRAEPRIGSDGRVHWFAWLRQQSRWIEIPDGKRIRERNPSVEEGHLCWTPASGVLCFVPPDTGG